MRYDALDDFAGPGGWDEGARMVGLKTLGFEWDQAACDTAEAAGHARIKIDVSLADAAVYRGKVPGYMGSPPCTLFSSAGSGVGNLVIHSLAAGIESLFRGEDTREKVREAIYPVTLAEAEKKNAKREAAKKWPQERVEEKARTDAFVASLVLEPARRIMQLDPEWIALEQVPEVLPLWQVYVRELRARGYSAWAGILLAADYGVPQTRERAVVMASRTRQVAPPTPTHSEHGDDGDLFGESRQRWISMADALGWGMHPRPSITLTAGSSRKGGPDPLNGGSGARETVRRERREGRWVAREDADLYIDRRQTGAPVVNVSERPCPAVTSAMFGKGVAKLWWQERPATTVVGSFHPEVISAPGYRTTTSRQNAEGSVTVTVEEAGILQSFPRDYPWQGSKSKQHEQVGNAVPPLLAAHVLAALTGKALEVA